MEPYDRTNDFSSMFTVKRNILFPNPSASTIGTIVVNSRFSGVSTIAGYQNPSWRTQVRRHQLATTSCSGTHRSCDPGYVETETRTTSTATGAWISTNQTYGALYTGNVNIVGATSQPATSVDNSALSLFYRRITEVSTRADGLVFLGELRRTVSQLRRPFRALIEGLVRRESRLHRRWERLLMHSTGRNRSIALRDLRRAASGTWLEAQFGLRPLVGDIERTASYLVQRQFEIGVQYYPVHAKARTASQSSLITSFSGGLSFPALRVTRTKKSVRYKGEVKVQVVESPVYFPDARRLGFSFSRFAPTLYELTPWSFLIDYFTNLGDVINAWSVPLCDVVWINKTVRWSNRAEQALTDLPNRTVGTNTVTPMYGRTVRPCWQEIKSFTRAGIEGYRLPRPSISFDLPNGMQFLNTVALAARDSRRRSSNLRL